MLKRDINFFDVIGQDSSGFAINFEKTLKVCLIIFAAIAIIVLGLMSMVNGGQKLKISSLENKIAAMEEQLKVVEELKKEAEGLQMDIDTFNQSVAEFDQQARLTTDDIQKIAAAMPNTVTLTSFTYSSGAVSLTCTGTSELAIADYANALRNSQTKNPEPTGEDDYYIKDFDDVTYNGVSKSGDNVYNAIVTVQLKSREVPEEEVPAEGEGEEATEEGAES